MSDRLLKESDVLKIAFQLPLVVNSAFADAVKALPSADRPQGDSVSRRYLLAEIDDLADEFSEVDENGLHSERWCGILDSKGIIVNAPSVSDRPQGEWIITEQDNGHKWTHRKCSECGKGIIEPLGVSGMNFCPNCGARMKGADNE